MEHIPHPQHRPIGARGSKDLGLLVVELSGDIRRLQIEITIYPDSLLFISAFLGASGQFAEAELISLSRPQSHYEDDRTIPYSCSSRYWAMYIRIQVLLKCTPVPFVLATSPVVNAVQYRRSSDWAWDPCSTSPQIPSPPPTSTPSSY